MKWRVQPSQLRSELSVPGDKSIGHRALMIASLAPGQCEIENLPTGQDVRSTARCLEALGTHIENSNEGKTLVSGRTLRPSTRALDAGNSGTTMRLLSGILAGQPFASTIGGDESLNRRPMGRIIDPLEMMGARIGSANGLAPLTIQGGELRGIRYTMPLASAQVKSCILLAGLFAAGQTTVVESVSTRDHTERMLAACGVPVVRSGLEVSVSGGSRPSAFAMSVPGDISTAAFFLTGAILSGGDVTIRDCGINPTRTGLLDVLSRMGAGIEISDQREMLGEPQGTVRARGSELHAVDVGGVEIPLLVDELPLVALAATQARGTSMVRDARELRVKESDRIHAVAESLSRLGADIQEREDGWEITGPTKLTGGNVNSYGDHRMAMMLAVAATVATGDIVIDGVEAAAVSFPEFADVFQSTGGLLYAA